MKGTNCACQSIGILLIAASCNGTGHYYYKNITRHYDQESSPVFGGSRMWGIGAIHEYLTCPSGAGDIVANWPEDQWPRLMRCRLRFGIRG